MGNSVSSKCGASGDLTASLSLTGCDPESHSPCPTNIPDPVKH